MRGVGPPSLKPGIYLHWGQRYEPFTNSILLKQPQQITIVQCLQ